MKIVADEDIPLVKNYFGEFGELVLKPGRAIARNDLIDADILLTRSVTKVNQELLANTAIKFVGSTTSGFDHLDVAWLDEHGIQWSIAKGCNATAVVEYILCVIAALQKIQLLKTKNIRAAVIGVGTIGQEVANKFHLLGFEVILCDPFRKDIDAISLAQLSEVDLISLHTPLTITGPHPTYHLIERALLQKQKKNCVLLNTARGAVISFKQLKTCKHSLIYCLDVWENEPLIDLEVLEKTIIATPHIAGYSLQSKYRGIEMIYQAALRKKIIPATSAYQFTYPTKKIFVDPLSEWCDVLLSVFNPLAVTQEMKKVFSFPQADFDSLRKKFTNRYEFGFIELPTMNLPGGDKAFLKQLGFMISDA